MWYLNPIKLSAETAHLAPPPPRMRQNNFNCSSKIWNNGKANRIDIIYFVYLHIVCAHSIALFSVHFPSSEMNLHTNERAWKMNNFENRKRKKIKRLCFSPFLYLIRCKKIKEFVCCACVCVVSINFHFEWNSFNANGTWKWPSCNINLHFTLKCNFKRLPFSHFIHSPKTNKVLNLKAFDHSLHFLKLSK